MLATELLQARRVLEAAALLLALQAASVFAQSPKSPVTDADVARAARHQPVITDKEIDALPQPQTQGKIDLGAIAGGFDAMGSPDPAKAGMPVGPTLLVFVSFSMPEPALERLVDQAARTGATLVLRGLVEDSMQKTVARVQRVIGQRKVGFQIDPQAFDRFAIAATPSFVLIKDRSVPTPCAAGACFSADSFALAAGDVSIDYALRFIQRTAPKYSREAQVFLAKMKGG